MTIVIEEAAYNATDFSKSTNQSQKKKKKQDLWYDSNFDLRSWDRVQYFYNCPIYITKYLALSCGQAERYNNFGSLTYNFRIKKM